MGISVSLIRKISEVEPPLRDVLISILEEIERQRSQFEQQVTKTEFNELKEIVRQLAEAQKKTEERMGSVEQKLGQLAEVQKRTEQKLSELAEAQKKTEQRLNELAEAQKETEQKLNELAEAQKKTEQEIGKLAKGLRQNRSEIGGLARSVAYALENEAYRHLPSLLKTKYNIELCERIIRCYVGGEEIDIFAKARQDGREIYLVGEAVLKLDDVTKLRKVWKKVEVVKEEYGAEVIPIIVTHFAKPDILEKANKAGILVAQSFEWV